MTKDLSKIEFPDEIKTRIHEVAIKIGCSDEEVVAHLMRSFFELVDDSEITDVPCFVQKVRKALEEASSKRRN